MRIKQKLPFFLGKRKTTLQVVCERNGIKSHSQLQEWLEDLGVECPPASETRHLFARKKPKVVPVQKQSHSAKPKGQSKKQSKKYTR